MATRCVRFTIFQTNAFSVILLSLFVSVLWSSYEGDRRLAEVLAKVARADNSTTSMELLARHRHFTNHDLTTFSNSNASENTLPCFP